MNIPSDLYYTRDHEWIRVNGEEGAVGITDYAQGELGDIVYVELPDVGAPVTQGKVFGAIEAVKAAADLYSPVTGEVTAINTMLEHSPELINKSPYDDGWMIKVKIADRRELETLMSADNYRKYVEQEGGG